jgi:hypothetical protein
MCGHVSGKAQGSEDLDPGEAVSLLHLNHGVPGGEGADHRGDIDAGPGQARLPKAHSGIQRDTGEYLHGQRKNLSRTGASSVLGGPESKAKHRDVTTRLQQPAWWRS